MTPLSTDLGKTILAFAPEVAHAQVSKGFAVWTKKAIEQEWQALGKNPLLAKQIAAIKDPVPLCFKKLLKQLHEVFLTSTAYDAFVATQPAFKGSYSRARFERGAALLVEDAQEQDRNLERAWRGRFACGMAWALMLNPNAPGVPQTANEIRTYLDAHADEAAILFVSSLDLRGMELTGIPPEVEKFPMIFQLSCHHNRIHNVPQEILNLRHLQYLSLDSNRFDRVPEVCLRYKGSTSFSDNPISVYSEEMYDQKFSWQNWLGRPFNDYNDAACCGFAYLFGAFRFAQGHVIGLPSLKEIPFALWLRNKLVISSPMMHLGNNPEQDLKWLPDFIKWTFLFACAGIAMLISPFLWVLNQFLSLVVVPIATKVRELLGYGRMIKL